MIVVCRTATRLLVAAALATTSLYGAALTSADPHSGDPIADSWQTTCDVLSRNLNGNPQHDADIFVRVVEGIQHRYVLSYDAGVLVMQQQVQQHCVALKPRLDVAGGILRGDNRFTTPPPAPDWAPGASPCTVLPVTEPSCLNGTY
jgi:hypothetical protein